MKPLTRWFLILLLLIAVIAWNYAAADPVARVSDHSAEIVLHNEDCRLAPHFIRNLPFRVVWVDRLGGGKVYEGCFGVSLGTHVMMYFEDGSVALLPTGSFTIMKTI